MSKCSPADAQRDRKVQGAADDVTSARNRINWCLKWAPLTDEQRAQLVQAKNALDMARECLSFEGPSDWLGVTDWYLNNERDHV